MLFFRNLHHIAERAHGSWHNCNFLHRLGVLLHRVDQRVADLVIRDNPALLRVHDTVFLLLADKHLLDCLEQILLRNVFPVLLDGVDGRLVDHVRKIAPHRAARCKCDRVQIDCLVHLHILGMHLENRLTAFQIRPVHDNSSVKTARAQQCLVQNLRTVCRAKNQNSLRGVEAVHLGEQLIERLFALFVSAAVLGVTASADRVDLIDEDDAGRVLRCFLEQVAHTRSADADIQLDKVGTCQREERYMRFSGDGFGKKCLAGSRRADKQRTLGQFRADLDITPRIVQEIHDFLQRFLGLVLARDIRERNAGFTLHIFLRVALDWSSHHSAAAAHSAENQAHQPPQEYKRQNIRNYQRNDHRRGILYLAADNYIFFKKPLCQCVVVFHLAGIVAVRRVLVIRRFRLRRDVNTVAFDLDAGNLSLVNHGNKLVIVDFLCLRGRSAHHIADNRDADENRQQDDIEILLVRLLPAAAAPGGRAGVAAAAAVVISQAEEIHEDPALQTLYFMRNQCCEFQIPLL